MGQLIVNPSLDGYTMQDWVAATKTWNEVVNGSGTDVSHGGETASVLIWTTLTTENSWRAVYRAIILFNTAALGDVTISSATLKLKGTAKSDPLNWTPDLCVYSSNPAANDDIVAGDHDSLGTTAFSDVITYASWSVADWNTFTLNAAGLAAINKTGITKFGIRNANYDVAEALDPGNHTPSPWGSWKDSYLFFNTSESTGNEPILTINYNVAVGSTTGLSAGKVKNLMQRFL